ncbi:TonB family protein [Hymenobacter sp. 5317J-9]|uniref:energy transducer TonB n=1 Tax=Hymenobacter sp. 5317J-9 TaxID=2932250 RepID=UPI001FD6C868|nr:energy transducer TonB [Hymenobacter sp. 5317J-9]UOQ98457.1 TonB family protein [Hymenobacter sp. 5317J-9]
MMTNTQLATASLDDIVFDGRNRHYGAYQLRALYQRHVTRALVIGTAIFALLLVFPLAAQWLKDRTPVAAPKIDEGNILIAPPLDPTIPPPPVTPPPAQPPAQAPTPPSIRFTPPVVAPDPQVTEEVPDQKDLQNARISTVTVEGKDDPGLLDEPLEAVEGPKTVGDAVDTKVYVSVEQMPELPGGGGQAAIVAAIQKSARYPGPALSNGIEGKIYASFTVNPKGEVTDVKIVRGLGYGLDEETMRAIKALPRFIPGKQNGREVSVSFTVPVTFKIQ